MQKSLVIFSKVFLTNFLLFISSLAVYSQNRELDSLKTLLSTSAGHERYDVICELGYTALAAGHYDQALSYSEQLLFVGKLNKDSLQTLRGLAIKASVLRRSNFIDSAKVLYNQILPIARRHCYTDLVRDISNSLGLLSLLEGQYDDALEYLFESLAIREEQQNKFEISVVLQNIGLVYYKLANCEQALLYNKRSIRLQRESKDLQGIEILLLNIALCHIQMKDFSAAQKVIDEAFAYCNGTCGDEFSINAHYSLGLLLYSQSRYTSAAPEFATSYLTAKKLGDARYQLDNLVLMAEISILRNNLPDAEKYLLEAEKVIEKDDRNRSELLEVYQQFYSFYKIQRRYKEMSIYQEKYITLKNNVFSEEVTSNLMKAEANLVEREKQTEIESQKKILALNEELLYEQKIASSSMGFVAVLGLLLAVMLAKNNRQKKIANKLLDERVKQRTQELQTSRDALQRAWHERDVLVAKNSGDIRGFLATVKGLCILGLKDVDHSNAADYFNKMNNVSDQLSEQLRKMSYIQESKFING